LVSQSSCAVVVNVTGRPPEPVHSTTMFEEQNNCGGVVSTTLIVWLHVLEFPQTSVADQVRVAVNVLPQCALVTVSTMASTTFVGSHASDTSGVSNVHGLLHSTTRFD
jgi:hypothetical protein